MTKEDEARLADYREMVRGWPRRDQWLLRLIDELTAERDAARAERDEALADALSETDQHRIEHAENDRYRQENGRLQAQVQALTAAGNALIEAEIIGDDEAVSDAMLQLEAALCASAAKDATRAGGERPVSREQEGTCHVTTMAAIEAAPPVELGVDRPGSTGISPASAVPEKAEDDQACSPQVIDLLEALKAALAPKKEGG